MVGARTYGVTLFFSWAGAPREASSVLGAACRDGRRGVQKHVAFILPDTPGTAWSVRCIAGIPTSLTSRRIAASEWLYGMIQSVLIFRRTARTIHSARVDWLSSCRDAQFFFSRDYRAIRQQAYRRKCVQGPAPMEGWGPEEARRRIDMAARDGAEELDLGGLGLSEIPEELYALTHLKILYLGKAKDVKNTPYWKRSEVDQKRRNAVRTLPPAFFTSLPHLTQLHLDQNGLVALAPEIVALVNLASLDLGGNYIGAEGTRALAGLVNLKSLDLTQTGYQLRWRMGRTLRSPSKYGTSVARTSITERTPCFSSIEPFSFWRGRQNPRWKRTIVGMEASLSATSRWAIGSPMCAISAARQRLGPSAHSAAE
jgi:hypothetical protein